MLQLKKTNMKKIRTGVFETNSSSTHSICIAKNIETTLPKSLHFEFGEFGWEQDTLSSGSEKASYLYTGLIANDRKSDFENIVAVLEKKGVVVSAEEPIYKKYSYEGNDGSSYAENGGYVDHSDQLNCFLNDICSDENKLINYLFSDLSFVITGNDNDDCDVDIAVGYEHDEYYKGN